MPDADLTRLGLAVLIQAPFAFRLGFVVRDGRQWLFGSLFLAVGSAVAAIAAGLSGSLLVGVGAALVAVFVLAQARFAGAQRPPAAAVSQQAPAPPSAALPPVAAPPGRTSPRAAAADAEPQVSMLLSGMAFLADLLTVADRIGELRHRRRMRKRERQQAERLAAGSPPHGAGRPPHSFRVRPTRGFPKLPPPK